MKEGYKFLKTLDEVEKPVEWSDLNQLKKDILWVYDENVKQINASFIPEKDFQTKYWEYLTLNAGNGLSSEEINFYTEGVLVILLCMTVEYIDTTGGNQGVFGPTQLSEIISYVEKYTPTNQKQVRLKEILLKGLRIAASMSPTDLINTDGFYHEEMDNFYSQLNWVSEAVIEEYYKHKLK